MTIPALLARLCAPAVFACLPALVAAQAAVQPTLPVPPPMEGVLALSASAVVEVPQDWMVLNLAARRDGRDATVVQTQLKQAVDAALVEARRLAKPGEVEVQTSGFSVYPRYGDKGQITGWQGSAQVTVEGRDMTAIAQLSGKISSMTIAQVSFGLSREAREKVESEVSAQAVARFRARAAELARHFGYAGVAVREVNVSTDSGSMPVPYPKMMQMARAESADVALPTEPGKGTVTATVSGTVQMKR